MYFFGSNCCNVIPFVSVVTFCCQWAEAQMTLLSVIKKCLSYLVYWKILFLLNTIIYDPVHHTFMCIYLNCAPLCLFMRMNYLYIYKKKIHMHIPAYIHLHTHICECCFQFSNFDKLVLPEWRGVSNTSQRSKGPETSRRW